MSGRTFEDAAAATKAWLERQRADTARLMAIMESPAEARLLVELLACGGPDAFTFGAAGSGADWTITPQHSVSTPGQTYRVDFALERGERKVAVEVDGWAFHADPVATSRDAQRDSALSKAGWHVVRLNAWEIVRSPLASVDTLLAQLAISEQHGRFAVSIEDMTDEEFAKLVCKFDAVINEASAAGEVENVTINRQKLEKLQRRRARAVVARSAE